MNLDIYSANSNDDHTIYEFISEGPKGSIRKKIKFKLFCPYGYNLAFGDWDDTTQKINDLSRSNNHDRDKIINTVAVVVREFLDYYPEAIIIATGSTPARTRLYQTAISSNLHLINRLFIIEGFLNNDWHPYEKDQKYSAFLVRGK